MRMVIPLLLAALAGTLPAAAQPAQRHGDQLRAWEARRDGRQLPLREIERRVVPSMPGWQYIGSDYDGESAVYTLKFLRDGRVIWVDVDGRTGQVLGRTR